MPGGRPARTAVHDTRRGLAPVVAPTVKECSFRFPVLACADMDAIGIAITIFEDVWTGFPRNQIALTEKVVLPSHVVIDILLPLELFGGLRLMPEIDDFAVEDGKAATLVPFGLQRGYGCPAQEGMALAFLQLALDLDAVLIDAPRFNPLI